MEVQAVSTVITLGQGVGLVRRGGEGDASTLPWVVRKVGVEDLVGSGEGA